MVKLLQDTVEGADASRNGYARAVQTTPKIERTQQCRYFWESHPADHPGRCSLFLRNLGPHDDWSSLVTEGGGGVAGGGADDDDDDDDDN